MKINISYRANNEEALSDSTKGERVKSKEVKSEERIVKNLIAKGDNMIFKQRTL